LFGIDRQVYYRSIKRTRLKRSLAEQVTALVKEQRVAQSRLGTRKLYHILAAELKELKVGRDKFFNILKANHLLIKSKKSYHVTTWSHHRFRKHPNLIKELDIKKPEQVWVSDITYIGKRDKPCYLSLITDAYSKKIMGYNVSNSLDTQGCIKALKMAHKNRKFRTEPLIHHSDRGIQYCSDEYQYLLKKCNLKCSMTQNSDPYENAVAERINGILKQEFMIDTYHLELFLMKKLMAEVINKYNQIRPHWSNYMLTPNQMHMQKSIKMKTYKTKNRSNPKATSV
jgi:putative transposase